MVRNFITEEIRETRHRLAAEFDNDVFRIGADLRRRQATTGRRVVQLPKRPPRTNEMPIKTVQPSGVPPADL